MKSSKRTECFITSAGALLALLVLGGSLIAHGQQITGSISGTVKDEQGAMVTTATIKATNSETGLARTTSSTADGGYLIQYLPVGTYTVEVNANGFKKFVQQNVVLSVDQTQALNVTLAVGTQAQTVTVNEAPPLVETTTAELGRTVAPAEIIGLPLVNRNAYAELSLTPGIQSNSASAQSNPSGTPNFTIGVPSTDVVMNGGIDAGVPMVSYYLDGGINMTGLRNYGNPLPNPDALQEVRVETSDFSAQYGRMSGQVVTAITKSGTNQFHGSLFEFNRNTDLNAYPWNAPKNTVGQFINAPYHRNNFGGVIGGPVKHDKAFFLFSYAGLRQVVGSFLSGGILPTTAQREGDFTAVTTTLFLPGTKIPMVGTNSSPNCAIPTQNCIPTSLLDPTAANLMTKYIPLPNSGINWVGYFTGPTSQDEYLGKYDQVLSDKDHVSGSYFYLNSTQNAFGGGNFPYMINQSYAKQQDVNISDIHTFGVTTANQAWLNWTRVAGGRINLPQVSIGDLGSSFTIQGPKALPDISVSGDFSVGGSLAGPISADSFFSLRDMISMTKGKHSLSYGGEASLEKGGFVGNLDNFGIFNFATSGPTTTGNAMADFVAGQVSSMEQDTPYHGLMDIYYYALFLQDNYRLTPRLTANLGLRWDSELPPVEASNLAGTFRAGVQSTVVPSAPQGLLYPGDAGVSRGIVGASKYHYSPRVGVAWDPFGDGKTAIRAGAGLFWGSVTLNEYNQPANAQPFAVRQVFSSITSLTNVYGNPASFPNGDPFPYIYNPKSPRFLPAASVETIAPNYRWPLTYQLNAAIERQLPGQISLTTAYVGNLSRNLPFSTDINYAPYAPGATTSQASINARRPYDPGVLGQVWYIESNQSASYHSLQISARRPLTHNLMLGGYYVWSHSIWSASPSGTGLSYAQDYDNLWEERGPSDLDHRNTASISGVWDIDYYRGSNFLMKQVVNGWTVSPIVYLYSGSPFNIATGATNNDDSLGNNRPNLVPGVSAFLDPHRCRLCAGGTAARWFNPAAFTPNGPGLGIGPGGADGTTPRDYLYGPGYRDVDLALLREFHFERGIAFQIRGEAINAFNLVSLNAPTATLTSANDGKITAAASPRVMQIGARFTF